MLVSWRVTKIYKVVIIWGDVEPAMYTISTDFAESAIHTKSVKAANVIGKMVVPLGWYPQ